MHMAVIVVTDSGANEDIDAALQPFYMTDPGNWDWYMIGGRWSGHFTAKPGAAGRLGEQAGLTLEPGVVGVLPVPAGRYDVIRKGDAVLDGVTAWAVVRDGVWRDCGETATSPFRGVAAAGDMWLQGELATVPDDHFLAIVDCHT